MRRDLIVFLLLLIVLVGAEDMKTDYDTHTLKTNSRRDYYLNPKAKHKMTIIVLHGLADQSDEFIKMFEMEEYNMTLPNARIVSLNGEERDISQAYYTRMNSWYDDMTTHEKPDDYTLINTEQLTDSTDLVMETILEESDKLKGDTSKIVLVGHCQEACLAYNTLLKSDLELDAIFGVNGYMPPFKESDITEKMKKVPILSFHGKDNEMVYERAHKRGYEAFKKLGLNINYKVETGVGHWISAETFKKFQDFLYLRKIHPHSLDEENN